MSNELTHWGIKGQKWGVRRYENEDGTLTEAGKIRYGKKRFAEDSDEFQSHNLDPREVAANSDKMTDRQLQAAFNRLNTQQNISKMVPVKKGKKYADKAVDQLTTALIAAGVTATVAALKKNSGTIIAAGKLIADQIDNKLFGVSITSV